MILYIISAFCFGVALTASYFREEVKIAYEDRDYYKELFEDAKEGLSGTVD